MGFVDIHSHVLYGLDDGAGTREESLAMLAAAASAGTTDIVATPHANGQFAYRPEIIAAQLADLGAETSVHLYAGCDFHLQIDNIEDALAHPDKYTINRKGYLLVEFPEVGIFPNIDEILARLLASGMTPIVTHPERNAQLRHRMDDLARWVGAGSYLQVTAGSYLGTFGRAAKTAAETLLARGLVHVVASDGHDIRFRPPTLLEAYQQLTENWGEDAIRPLFVDNPGAVVGGEAIDYEFRGQPPKARKWYQFWG